MRPSQPSARAPHRADAHVGPNARRFEYRAVRPDGAVEDGVIMASDRSNALRRLNARGLWGVDLHGADDRAAGPRALSSRGRTMPFAELALGLRVLADFLDARLPVARSLSALEEMAPASWRSVLPGVRVSIRDGKSLATALTDAPLRFPALVIGLIRAGEMGVGLATGTRRAADLMEDIAATRAALRSALAYPLVLLVAGTASLCLLVGVIIPRFANLLTDLGEALPPTTRLLLTASSVARDLAIPALLLLSAAYAAWRMWSSSDDGRREWHALLLRLPMIGPARLTVGSSRVCAALAALLESGVPMAPALDLAAKASNDAMLTAHWLDVREAVVRGERLGSALASHRAATLTTVRLIRAGEETGQLPAMLVHAARIDREVTLRRTRTAIRMIEPALILVFGAMIAFVAAALLQALYGIRPT